MTSSTFEFQNTNESREFSLSKKRYLNTSFPLNDLDNYVLKFSQRFDNFTFFARTQYSVENKSVNENIVGAEWYKDCFKFRLAFERARFFPFTEVDYSKGNYFDQIYLTNPILKNNLSFEFELIGLTNPLKPINTLIQMDFLIKILIPLFAAFILQANSLDRVAVIVNDGVVLESEINQKITDIEKASALNGEKLPSKDEIRNKVIEELILEELQLQVADQVGIKISDEELNVTLKRLAQQSDLDLESFIKFVEDQGDSYEQVRENVKRTMKIQRVQQGRIQNKIQITREELNNFLNTEEAKSQLGPELGVKQILVRNNSDKNIDEVYQTAKQQIEAGINPTEVFKNLSEDQNGGDLGYRNITKFPGVFQDPINELEIGEFSEVIETGAGKHILYLDDKRGPMVTFEKQWEVRHILLIPNRIRDENDSEDDITEIRNRIISGESFGELAREFSDDPGSKQEGGRLDWAPEGTYAPEFEKVMTESSENQISEPFLTQFGWHILEVTGIRVVDKTNERMEDQAFSYLFNRKFQEELETDLQELRAEAFVEIKES